MNIKRFIENIVKEHRNVCVLLSFFLISIICMIRIIITGKFAIIGDEQFHWQRINELFISMNKLNFEPSTAVNYFSSVGSSVMTMYPYFTLIPVAALLYVFKNPLLFFYVFFILSFFFSMVISFYSSYGYNRNFKISYLFSIIYGVLSNNLFWQMDIGMQLAIVFLPLSIFGFLSFLKDNKWIEMSIGMSILILTHVVSFVVVFIVLFFWLIFNFKNITLSKVINLIRASTLALASSAIYWIPAIRIFTSNSLVRPLNIGMIPVDGTTILKNALSPYEYIKDAQLMHFTVSIIAFLTIFIGLLYFKKLNKLERQIYFAGVITIILYSNIFPWGIFTNSFINVIQCPDRFYIVPQLLLDYLFAVILIKYFNKDKYFIFKSLILIAFCMIFQFSIQNQYVNRYINNDNKVFSKDDNISTFYEKTFSLMGSDDYWPQETSNYGLNGYISQKTNTNINNIDFVNEGNGHFKFNSANQVTTITVPYLYYNGLDYKVTVNGKVASVTHDQDSLIQLNNVSAKKGVIVIKPSMLMTKFISTFISLLGLMIYIMLYFKNKRTHKDNKKKS